MDKISNIKTFSQVETARQDLEWREDALLRKDGWIKTCSGTRSLWLWTKMMKDGRIFLVDKKTAIYLANASRFQEGEVF